MCESCNRPERPAKPTLIHGAIGTPVLCASCADLRRARVARNKHKESIRNWRENTPREERTERRREQDE